MSNTNWAAQPQKMARDLKFWMWKVEGLYYVVKTKVLISFAVTAKLICVFVFAYAKIRFSYDEAHINKGHVLLRRVFSLIQKSDQNYWIFGCFYWYTTQFAITDTALNYSMTNNVKRRRREN